MQNHLLFEIDGNPVKMKPGSSLNFNFQNPIFNDIETFSYPIDLPVTGNGSVIGNVADIKSSTRPMDIDKKKAKIWIDNIPIVSGQILTDDNVDVEDIISVSVNSTNKTFKEMISDMKCTDVDPGEVVIGEKIGQVNVTGTITVYHSVSDVTEGEEVVGQWHDELGYFRREVELFHENLNINVDMFLDLPALGFSYPAKCEEDAQHVAYEDTTKTKNYTSPNKTVKVPKVSVSYINTSMPFDNDHPYCNARICYKHYGVEKEKDSDKYKTTSEITKDKSNINEAKWPYWVLDADRPTSGICFYVLYFLRRLFLKLGIAYDDSDLFAIEDMRRLCFFTTKCAFYEKTKNESLFKGSVDVFTELVNKWTESRGCGSKIELKVEDKSNVNYDFVDSYGERGSGQEWYEIYKKEEWNPKGSSLNMRADLNEMIATGDNFPNVSVSEVIESLENSFGVRFVFDSTGNVCKAVLIRDVFRNNTAPLRMMGKVLSINKTSEKITGVKVCYSAESDAKEQKEIVRKGVRKYDTDYDYTDYPPESQNVGIVSSKPQTVTNKVYREFFTRLSSSDMTTYVDKTTGNAYRIKIDSDAKEAKEWNPVVFEVGGYKGVEIGDCSESNQENMVTLTSHFAPVVFSDVNYQEELNQDNPVPCFAAYVDEEMEHEFVESYLESVSEYDYGKVTLKVTLSGIESYDPTQTEDGNSPLQHIDWGLAVAMMRGGGSSSFVINYDNNYDNFGNDKWQMMAGKDYQMFNDTMTHFGQKFDYNGDDSGDGGGERFSLKIRAYKQPDWADGPLFSGSITDQNRGTFDTFMAEFVYFLLYRQRYRIKMLCTAAMLAEVKNHWESRFCIDDIIGYINKLSCSISDETGMGVVTIDFFAI